MIGTQISHYRILEKLGEGGMGVVYKAHDTKLDRYVALKFLPLHLDASAEDISRFQQEARAISALNHPNIETIYDVDEVNGQKYLVLEYIPGGTLKSKLKQLKSEDKAFSIDEVLDFGLQLAEGLAHAHRHQIIHRDVKTDNILLTEEGKAKLTDFGLAKLRGTIHKTRTGSTLGTLSYMSAEQLRGEEVDQRSDIFSLGVVLYELVTSHLPFAGEYEAAVTYAILNEHPPKIRPVRPDVPSELEKIIDRCLEKDRGKRYQQAEEIIAGLRTVQQVGSGSAKVSAKPSKVWWVGAAMVIILAMIGAYLFNHRSGPLSNKQKSIAILPFKNLSESKEDEYFSDGMTDDIIAQLSKISDLKVISRTSVMQYKGTNKHIRQIGKELDVRTVLEGSVRHAGNQVRIVAQLIDAQNEGHLWADTYDEEMTQIFAVQSDVAQKIASALKAKLAPGEKERIEKKQTENTEAYELYLKGRFYWNKRTLENHRKAIEYFNQAIERDPHYALAYVGLASTYVLLPEYSVPSKDAFLKADSIARKALELDATLSEPHAVLGTIKIYKWDWDTAEAEFKKAIQLDPNNPTAHHWYSSYLSDLGRFNEALNEIRRARELDPLSLMINLCVGKVLLEMRQPDRAMEQFKKTLELDPDFPWAYLYLGIVYELQGEFDQAIAAHLRAITLAGSDLEVLPHLGSTYAKAGRRVDALKALEELHEYLRQGHPVSFEIAMVYNGLGDTEKTFEWLEKAFQEQNYNLAHLNIDPIWDNIRSDPRFIAFLKRMRLEK